MQIKARVWLYPGPAAWHFITLPKKISADIKKRMHVLQKAWGSLAVTARIGKTQWRTSIFPDKKAGAYLLPVKAEVRKKEGIAKNDVVTLHLEVVRPEFGHTNRLR